MGLTEIIALALALGADCFSVCLGLAMEGGSPKRTLLLSMLFGGMQGVLVALGHLVASGFHWLLHAPRIGQLVVNWLPHGVDAEEFHEMVHWTFSALGVTVLLAIGINLISEALVGAERSEKRRGKGRIALLLVAVSVNIDAFSAGVGLGMLDTLLLPLVVAVMALVGGSLCRLGFEAGSKVGDRIGRFAHPIGGGLMLLVAVKAVIEMLAR